MDISEEHSSTNLIFPSHTRKRERGGEKNGDVGYSATRLIALGDGTTIHGQMVFREGFGVIFVWDSNGHGSAIGSWFFYCYFFHGLLSTLLVTRFFFLLRFLSRVNRLSAHATGIGNWVFNEAQR